MRSSRRRTVPLLVLLAGALLLASCATTGPTPQERLAALFPPDRPFAESRFSTFGGVTLHYRIWAPLNEPRHKLLLLHTEGASTVSFRLLGPKLADAGVAVLAVDLPAFGWSDPALEFDHSLPSRSNLVWSLVDRLDTEPNAFSPADSWVVGGHGMGGQVAAQMALDRPARSRGLILFATRLDEPTEILRFSWFPPVRWAMRGWLENSLYTPEGVEELLTDAYGRPAEQAEVDLYTAPLLREDMARAYVSYARGTGTVDLPIEQIATETLMLWGSADATIPAEHADVLEGRLPSVRRVDIGGSAHLPMETHLEETADAIVGWLGSID